MLKRLTLLATALTVLSSGAWAQDDYQYYAVKSGETVESIAKRMNVAPEAITRLNPGTNVQQGAVIFVPLPPKPTPKRAVVRRQADKEEAVEQIAAGKTERELSEEDVEAIYEDTVKPLARRIGASIPSVAGFLPSHQNVMITSDGRALAVPTARPKPAAPETEEHHQRRSLSSRRAHKAQLLLRSALKYMGVPYVWGGEDPTGFDCSGFVQHVFARHGVRVPRTADLQYEVGRRVTAGKEQPGDLVFFETYCPGASHVGICLGKHQFVHASSSAGQITISDLREDRFRRCYLGAKRVW